MAATRRRPRSRETARPNVGGVAAEHISKIMASAIAGAVVIVAVLTLTSIGHTIDLAVQHFMLYYAGVLALIALCASVGAGLVSTDRMFLHPGQRVMMQSIHRAVSFGAFTFLIVHVVTEILAQRIDVIDAFIPFLQPFKTFYIGLGTIASDIIILLVITGILRKRFVANGENTWRWRAIHYTNYVAFVFGVWHGLLGGRPGKPYVDWSYGFVVAFVALGIAIRVLSNSLRPREALSAPAVAESATSGTAPLRAAMLAQASTVRRPAPAAMTAGGGSTYILPAAGPGYEPARVVRALPAGPGYDDVIPTGPGYNDTAIQPPPVYEPGYDGPPRYQGAPRPASGPMQAVPNSTISGPLPQVRDAQGYGRPAPAPRPRLPAAPGGGYPRGASGPMPRVPGGPTGAFARPATGPMPPVPQGPPSGGFRRPTGPMPQAPGGPSGGYPRPPRPPVPPPGYQEASYGGDYGGAPKVGAGYDGAGYEGGPAWDGVPQDPRRGYRGGGGPR